MTRRRVVSVGFLVLSGVLYFGCLFETGFCFSGYYRWPEQSDPNCKHALWVLIFGAFQQLGFFLDGLAYLSGDHREDISYLAHAWANLSWWANPLLLASWLLVGIGATRKLAVRFSLAALVTASAFMAMQEAVDCANEIFCTVVMPIGSLGRGYWLWLASMGAAVVAAFLSERIFRLPPPFKP